MSTDWMSRTYLDDLADEARDVRDHPDPADLDCPPDCTRRCCAEPDLMEARRGGF